MKFFRLNLNIVVLIIILIIGFLLRFIALGSNPSGLHADEADTGYTALSLIKTGKDPYGYTWPLQFKDQASNYRAPLYTYTVIPFVYVFGLYPEVIRFPSVLFGVCTILIVYIILKNLFNRKYLSLLGAFLIAINPWSIHLSRTGLEVNLSLLLTSCGVLLFLLKDKYKWALYFSALFFGLSLFSYHPAKIFSPLMITFLFLLNLKDFRKAKISYIIFSVIFCLFVSVIGYLAVYHNGATRLSQASIFDNTEAYNAVNSQRNLTNAPLSISSIFSNKPIYYLREFTNHYAGILSINYLFINGDNNLDKGIGNYGQFHFFELIPFVVGFYLLFNKNKRLFFIILGWFFIALIPAGITKNGYYAYRDVNVLIPTILITSIGFYGLFTILVKRKLINLLYLYVCFSLVLFSFFIYNYFFAYPVYSSDAWAKQQIDAIRFISSIKNKNIYIEGGLDWPIIYAFVNRLNPEVFQNAYLNRRQLNGNEIVVIDNYTFGDFRLSEEKKIPEYFTKDSLLVTSGQNFTEVEPIEVFYNPARNHIIYKIVPINE